MTWFLELCLSILCFFCYIFQDSSLPWDSIFRDLIFRESVYSDLIIKVFGLPGLDLQGLVTQESFFCDLVFLGFSLLGLYLLGPVFQVL